MTDKRKVGQKEILTNTEGYLYRRIVNGITKTAGSPLTNVVKYGRNRSNICTKKYLLLKHNDDEN
jgi:hypothetical protein